MYWSAVITPTKSDIGRLFMFCNTRGHSIFCKKERTKFKIHYKFMYKLFLCFYIILLNNCVMVLQRRPLDAYNLCS